MLRLTRAHSLLTVWSPLVLLQGDATLSNVAVQNVCARSHSLGAPPHGGGDTEHRTLQCSLVRAPQTCIAHRVATFHMDGRSFVFSEPGRENAASVNTSNH